MAGLSDFLHIAPKFYLLSFCACFFSLLNLYLTDPQRILTNGNLPLAGICRENHLEPQNEKAALPPSHLLSLFQAPILALCPCRHLSWVIQHNHAHSTQNLPATQNEWGGMLGPETWQGSTFQPSKILVSDLHSFLVELNDVTKIESFLKTIAGEKNIGSEPSTLWFIYTSTMYVHIIYI